MIAPKGITGLKLGFRNLSKVSPRPAFLHWRVHR